MENWAEFWHWTQRIAGIVFLVLVSLYIIQCLSHLDIVGLDYFDHYIRSLIKNIFK